MEKYQEKPKERQQSLLKNSNSQIDKSGTGELTSRPKSSLDKYQGRASSTYRERSTSNVRGIGQKQSTQCNVKMMRSQNSTSTFNSIACKAIEQL